MKNIICTLLLLFFINCLFAQTSKPIIMKAGDRWDDPHIKTEVFLFPEFTFGKLYSLDGDSSGGKMNYNLLMDEMQFIGPKNDTLALADPKNIKYILINNRKFFYDQGYLEQVQDFSIGKIAVRQVTKVADKQKIGVFGLPNSTGAIESRDAVRHGNVYKLSVNEDIVLIRDKSYYLSNSNNKFILANKKSLEKLFPKYKKEIEVYISQNSPNFQSVEDLQKLMSFLHAVKK